jgi:protein arginine N-methyltransferase 1
MGEMEYSVGEYGSMIADTIRMEAYVRALERAITPGCFVLELGTGPGVMALIACRLGAGRVVAVEPDDVIEIGRETARANGVQDRIEFRQAFSKDIELDERADVMVSDLRGVLPYHTGHIESIVDARKRLVAPKGALIPGRDTLWAAVVTAPDLYRRRVEVWSDHARELDLDAARELAVNTWWRDRIEESQLLTERNPVATLEYSSIDEPDLEAETSHTVGTSGKAHGICVWFDTELVEGVGFSNAPGGPEAIYGQAFFPLSRPVDVLAGDTVGIRLVAKLTAGEYVWGWSSSFMRDEDVIAAFRQSTALGLPVTRRLLERSSEGFVPLLSEEGEAVKVGLESMNGERALQDIAARLSTQFPEFFARGRDSLQLAVRLAQKYSR